MTLKQMFLSSKSLIPAKHIRGSAWLEHAPFAFWLMENLAPRTVVELGTHKGFSFLTLCQAVKEMDFDARIYAVDTWQGDKHAGYYSSEIFDALEAELRTLYPGIGVLIKSTFTEARPQFGKGSIDLLHIDGRHMYEDVLEDFRTWKDTLSDKGVVLLHDTCVQRDDFGVWKFWNEIEGSFPSFEFFHGNGLGVLVVGENAPSILLDLCNANSEEQLLTKQLYSRLGSRNPIEYHFNTTNSAHQKTIKELSDKLLMADKKNKDITILLERAITERDKSGHDLLHQKDITSSILSSTSWKITAPYRYFASRLISIMRNIGISKYLL